MLQTKTCKECKETKNVDEFYWAHERGKKRYWTRCKVCVLKERRASQVYGSKEDYRKAVKRSDFIKCKECGSVKGVDEFYKNRLVCKKCELKKCKEKYQNLPEDIKNKIRERSRNYGKRYTKTLQYKQSSVKNKIKREYALSGLLMDSGILDKLLSLYGGRCLYCGDVIYKVFEIDHIIPLTLGGGTGFANLVLCCEFCNKMKNNSDPFDFCKICGVDLVGVLRKHMEVYKYGIRDK